MSIAKSLLLLTAVVGALGLLIIAIVYQNPACAFGAVTLGLFAAAFGDEKE